MNRRKALKHGVCAVLGSTLITNAPLDTDATQNADSMSRAIVRGRLRQSVARWCFQKTPLDVLCRAAKQIGLHGIDLLTPEEWTTAARFDLACAVGYTEARSITKGLNDPANHDFIVESFAKTAPLAARAKVPNLIAFFGNRETRTEREGMDNCIRALNRIKPIAESNGVTLVIELLNSKIDHKDYQGDRTRFGVDVVKAVNSPRVKLLYDIYHMQIMEGDVIRTIREHHTHIGHYHTGGVPGRHEIDRTQELNYPAICQAIIDTDFKGFLAHEFIPARDPLASLREAAVLCDVG